MKKYIIALVLLVFLGGSVYFLYPLLVHAPTISTQTNGIKYTHASADDIVVASPKPGDFSGSIIDVSGRARGGWYFEASFPIEVVDSAGMMIGHGVATAEGEWMTEEFVPFTSTITLTTSYTGTATLILKKDNPSGEPSKDASISLPITIQ